MRKRKNNRRQASNRRLGPRKALLFFILLGLVGLSVLSIWRLKDSKFFAISRIDSQLKLDKRLERSILGNSLFDVDIEDVYRHVKKRHPQLKEIQVRKIFPSTLKIEVVKRKPFAQLKNNGFYLLDEEGVALAKSSSKPFTDILTIELGNYPYTIRKGREIRDERLTLSYELAKAIQETTLTENFDIDHINASNALSLSFLLNEVNIIMGEGDFEHKLYLLEELLRNRFDNNVSFLQYIDLRYASSDDNILIGNKR